MRSNRSLRSPFSVAVAAVAATLVLASCGSDEPAEDTASTTETSAPAEDPAETEPTEEATPDEEPEAAGKTLEITVDGDTISPNGAEMSLSVGDELVLDITSDREGELHVHARPEAYVQFGPGETTERIVFENPGTVEIEDHGTGFVIALVQVR